MNTYKFKNSRRTMAVVLIVLFGLNAALNLFLLVNVTAGLLHLISSIGWYIIFRYYQRNPYLELTDSKLIMRNAPIRKVKTYELSSLKIIKEAKKVIELSYQTDTTEKVKIHLNYMDTEIVAEFIEDFKLALGKAAR